VGLAVVLLAALGGPQWFVIVLFVVWGVAFGGLPSLLHGRVLGAASPRIRDLASASLTTAFNLAIGGGALVGGFLLDAFGVGMLPWADAALVVVALAFVIGYDLRNTRMKKAHDDTASQITSAVR
jgi:predicted MFS family arabinose efflux permease